MIPVCTKIVHSIIQCYLCPCANILAIRSIVPSFHITHVAFVALHILRPLNLCFQFGNLFVIRSGIYTISCIVAGTGKRNSGVWRSTHPSANCIKEGLFALCLLSLLLLVYKIGFPLFFKVFKLYHATYSVEGHITGILLSLCLPLIVEFFCRVSSSHLFLVRREFRPIFIIVRGNFKDLILTFPCLGNGVPYFAHPIPIQVILVLVHVGDNVVGFRVETAFLLACSTHPVSGITNISILVVAFSIGVSILMVSKVAVVVIKIGVYTIDYRLTNFINIFYRVQMLNARKRRCCSLFLLFFLALLI